MGDAAKTKRKVNRKPYYILIVLLAVILLLIAAVAGMGVRIFRLETELRLYSSAAQEAPVSSAWTQSQLDAMANADAWYLALANADHPLPDDFSAQLSLIEPQFARDEGMQFDARAVDALNQLCRAAQEEGVSLLVISAYRSISRQTYLYNQEVQRQMGYGLSEEQAKQEAAKVVAIPGTSDHNLGLAVDFNSVEVSFEQTRQFEWLQQNAQAYGFILRYPKDKQDLTKISYEPWHYRYVGTEHAAQINDRGMCLEEYVAFLQAGGDSP